MNDQCFNSEKIIRKPKENSYSRYSARKLKIDFKPIRNIASFACDSPTTEDILNNSFVESTSESPQKSDTGIGLLHHSNYEDKDRQINDNKITSIHETNYFQTPQSVSSRISKLQINKTEHDTPVSSGEHSLMPPKFTPNDSIVLLQQKSALKNQHPVPKQKSIPVISTPHGIKETCFQTPIQKEIPIQKPCKTLFPTNPLSLQTIPEKNQHDNIPNVKQKENICQNNQINPPIKKQINYVSKNPNPITKVNFVLGSMIKLKGREYKIYHKIGQGGSCEVYEAVACEDLAKRAIKCVNLAVNSATAQGYIEEINMLRNLQSSDYVVKMFDCDIIENILFVVMERGDVDLAQLLGNTGNVHLPMILFYWTEMLNAVKCIHDEGIIHSDLKPANFLLVKGRLKLIDFGIASKVQDDVTSIVKTCQAGTFSYMSPEALTDMRTLNGDSPTSMGCKFNISYKSDVWSLGCILYRLLYGRTPFQHITNKYAKLAAITSRDHHIVFPMTENTTPRLLQTLKACLTYEMRMRPSVDELLQVQYYCNKCE